MLHSSRLLLVAVLLCATPKAQHGGSLWGDHWVKWKGGRLYVPRQNSWDHKNYGKIFLYTPDNIHTPQQFPVGKVDSNTILTTRSCQVTFVLKEGSAGCYLTDREWDDEVARGVSCYLGHTAGSSNGQLTARDRSSYTHRTINSGLSDDALMEIKLTCSGLDFTSKQSDCTCSVSKIANGETTSLQSISLSNTADDGRYYGMLAKASSWDKVEVRTFHFDDGNIQFIMHHHTLCGGTQLTNWNPRENTAIPSSDYQNQNVLMACLREPLCNAVELNGDSTTFRTGVLNLHSSNYKFCYVKQRKTCPAPPRYSWLMRPDECQAVTCEDRCNFTPIGQSQLIAGNRLTEDMNNAQNKLEAATNGVDYALAMRASVMTGLKAVALGAGPLGIFAGVLGAVVGTLSATPEQLIAELTKEINARLAAVQDCIESTSNRDWAANVYRNMASLYEQVDTQLKGTAGLSVRTIHGRITNAWSDCTAKQAWLNSPSGNTAQRNMLMIPAADLFAETCWALSTTYITFLGEKTTIDSGDWTSDELNAEVFKVAQETTQILGAAAAFAHAVRTTMERDIRVEAEINEYTKPKPIKGWNDVPCKLPKCKLSSAGLSCSADYKYLETCKSPQPFAKHWIGARYLATDSYRPPCQKVRTRFINKHATDAVGKVIPLAKLAYDGCLKIKRGYGQEACEAPPTAVAAVAMFDEVSYGKWVWDGLKKVTPASTAALIFLLFGFAALAAVYALKQRKGDYTQLDDMPLSAKPGDWL